MPTASTVAIPAGVSTIFQVGSPPLATHVPSVTWLFDDVAVATGASLSVAGSSVPSGSHTLTAVVRDATPFVRSDPSGVLQARRSWTISGGGTALPASPTNLAASASGSVVTLTWTAPAAGATPTAYSIEAGSGSGLADLANVPTGSVATMFTAAGVGAGRYYVRVRSVTSVGSSAPTADALLVVGSCGGAPTLSSQVVGSTVTLVWTPSAGAVSYQLEAGSASGVRDLVDVDTGNLQTTFVATGVGAGTYFVRIRANTSCGQTVPSNEITVVVR